jgi:hypothetical protein
MSNDDGLRASLVTAPRRAGRKSKSPSGITPFHIMVASFEGRRTCEADVPLDQNPYRRAGQEHLADAWEDSWVATVDIL